VGRLLNPELNGEEAHEKIWTLATALKGEERGKQTALTRDENH